MSYYISPFFKLFIAVAAGIGIFQGYKHAKKKKIFISFAIEDKNVRDLLDGQSHNDKTPFEFIDMSVKQPWEKSWKTECRKRIKDCHGVIALISQNTIKADGACWEILCAKQEKIPIMAMYISKNRKGYLLPNELKGEKVYDWSWANIERFIAKLD